jgi:hypothetical protein
MQRRLGGWTRIGIILSVIWFVGSAGYWWNDAPTATAVWQEAVVGVNHGIPVILVVSLITIGLWWLLTWGPGSLVRWIRRGFAIQHFHN